MYFAIRTYWSIGIHNVAMHNNLKTCKLWIIGHKTTLFLFLNPTLITFSWYWECQKKKAHSKNLLRIPYYVNTAIAAQFNLTTAFSKWKTWINITTVSYYDHQYKYMDWYPELYAHEHNIAPVYREACYLWTVVLWGPNGPQRRWGKARHWPQRLWKTLG